MQRYLAKAMLRQLLTLMAVICGFTLTAQPVLAAQSNVVSVAQAAERADSAVQGTRPAQLAETIEFGPSAFRPSEQPTLVVQVPTVMLRVDRSRE